MLPLLRIQIQTQAIKPNFEVEDVIIRNHQLSIMKKTTYKRIFETHLMSFCNLVDISVIDFSCFSVVREVKFSPTIFFIFVSSSVFSVLRISFTVPLPFVWSGLKEKVVAKAICGQRFLALLSFHRYLVVGGAGAASKEQIANARIWTLRLSFGREG